MQSHIQRRAQRAALVVFSIVQFTVALVLCLGRYVSAFVRGVAVFHATQFAFGDGVSPASMQTVDLPQSQLIFYDKAFLEPLQSETPWVRATNRRTLPANSGNTLQLFMYRNMGPKMQQAPEGTVEQGSRVSVLSNQSRIGQWADFINLSDLADQTTLDPALENISKLLGYRAATTINTIVQNVADTAPLIDSSVNAHSKAANAPLTTADITTNTTSLAGRDIKPMEGGMYRAIIHNFVVGDLLLDNAVNGIVDVAKRTVEGSNRLRELPSSDGDTAPVLQWQGVEFWLSNLVKQTPNYLSSGHTALRTYILGQDALFTVSLGATGNTSIGDGRNLQMWVKRILEPQGYDPSRMIAGFTSYNFKMTATLPPDPVQRMRIIDSVPITS